MKMNLKLTETLQNKIENASMRSKFWKVLQNSHLNWIRPEIVSEVGK